MRYRFALAAAVPAAVLLGGLGTAHAVPTAGDTPANHGQCVSESAKPSGKGGRSAAAKPGGSCKVPPLPCVENEAVVPPEAEPVVLDTISRDSDANSVTISGAPGTLGSSLECTTDLFVVEGTTLTFSYDLAEGTDPCGGGVPRVFVVIDGTAYNSFDGDTDCSEAVDGTITYPIPVGGTITQVGFVYDRADEGSVTYSNTAIGGTQLDI